MGCHCFGNYRHLLVISKDGTFLNNGEFPALIGAYVTIPKALCGKSIDQTSAKCLEVVHIDTALRCMSIGSFKYALTFGDRVTRYNWCFGLK